jgi:hypothetical protein
MMLESDHSPQKLRHVACDIGVIILVCCSSRVFRASVESVPQLEESFLSWCPSGVSWKSRSSVGVPQLEVSVLLSSKALSVILAIVVVHCGRSP